MITNRAASFGVVFQSLEKWRGAFSNHWKILALLVVALGAAAPARAGFIGWAGGGSNDGCGVLLCTTNGTDWFRQGVGQLPAASLSGVAAVNGRHVWVVGDSVDGYAAIYYSPDGGVTWARQGDADSLPDVTLHKVWAVDRLVVWAVGVGGAVVMTADGGITWRDVSIGSFSQMLQGVTALDEYTAWVSGELDPDSGMAGLFHTVDGGATWMPQTSAAITNANHLLGLYALDENQVWAIGGQETVLATTNGGADWNLVVKRAMKDGNELCVRDARHIWAANDSHITWTTNGGATWESFTTWDYTMDVVTPDGTNIWAVRNNYDGGSIYHSADGGTTWTTQLVDAALTQLFTIDVQPAAAPRTLYVAAASGGAAPPYDSWATAASNIQDAVDAAVEGDLVLVTNGVYKCGGAETPGGQLSCRVVINKEITVRSVNGPEVTLIEGAGPNGPDAVRGAYVGRRGRLIGFTLTNGHVFAESQGMDYDVYGGGILMEGAGWLSNCVVSGNSGGAILVGGAADAPCLDNCRVQNNQAWYGSGIIIKNAGNVRNCWIVNNTAIGNGGGVQLDVYTMGTTGVLENCYIAGNRVTDDQGSDGGGVNAGGVFAIRNCTIVGNAATGDGGGLYALGDPALGRSEVVNTIIYHNTATTISNVFALDTEFNHCCAVPLLDGAGNIASDPRLVGVADPHLLAASPCRNAGATNGLAAGVDIDNEPRIYAGQVDIGCDEYIATNITGALTARIDASDYAVLLDMPVFFSADVQGKALWTRWLIQTNGGTATLSNTLHATWSWPVAGVYTVRLEAANLDLTAATTLPVRVLASAVHYAAPSGGNVYPYTNWNDAATSLVEAVVNCPGGGVVYAGTGTFVEATAVSLTRAVSVVGAGAAGTARVDGRNDHACFYINHPMAVVSNLILVNGSAVQGGGAYVRDGTVANCLVVSNYAASQGGGLDCWGVARVSRCEIIGNEAGKWGGGIMANDQVEIRDCLIRDNNAHNYGGGANIAAKVTLKNSFISGNRAFGGAGVHLDGGGVAQNCTLLKNMAVDNGGGVLFRFDKLGAVYNCIVYHNEAPVGPNIMFQVALTGTVEYTCAWPLFNGPGNFADEPRLLGLDNPHIVAASPCINAGSTDYVGGIEQDIDMEARIYGGHVDLGCDEFIGTNILGPLTVAIRGATQVVAGEAANFFADIHGKAWGYRWTVAGAGATNSYADTFMIAPTWSTPGYYAVTLFASNLAVAGAATVNVHVVAGGFTNYVAAGGAHIPPFTNWAAAATNLQAAIDACYVGGVVRVATGAYAFGQTVELAKPIAVLGAADPADCLLDGAGSYRVININHPRALLAGFTIANGSDEDAGGVYMLDGTVSNCVIADNESTIVGGGIRCAGSSLLTDSRIAGNTSPNWPGGVFCSGRATLRRCLIEKNRAYNAGGGVYCDQNGLVTDCLIRANSAMAGGGVYLHYGGTVTHSLLHSNVSGNGAGAFFYWGGVITNCDITWNWGQYDGGGLWFDYGGVLADSRLQHNFADVNAGHGGGAVMSGGGLMLRCDVSTNTAAFGAGIHAQYSAVIDSTHIHHNVVPEGWGEGTAGGVMLYQNNEMRNCLVEQNTSANMVGGVLLRQNDVAWNCTIANNSAAAAIGGVAVGVGSELHNCIIYDNTAPAVTNWDVDDGAVVEYCCTAPDSPQFAHTITAAPAFVGGGDYRLQAMSPCVNTGANEDWMTNAADLAGLPRIIGPRVDVGAFEFPLAPANVRAAVTGDVVRVSWAPAGGATGVRVYRSRDMGAAGSEVAALGAGVTSWSDTAVSCGQAYYYATRADYGAGASAMSAQSLARRPKTMLDFDGDRLADLAVCWPTPGRWYVLRSSDTQMVMMTVGSLESWPAPGDYDGDCRADLTAYRQDEGLWYGVRSSDAQPWQIQWGWSAAIPVPADYDADGRTDLAVYWPAQGRWYVLLSATVQMWESQWGWSETVPVPADYDGDGKADLAVYWPAQGRWYVWKSAAQQLWEMQWGSGAAIPVPADYDGDGQADLAVYWAESGSWAIRRSSDNLLWLLNWGWSVAQPAPLEYHRPGVWDTTVYDPALGNWFMLDAGGGACAAINWGWYATQPVSPLYQVLKWYGLLPGYSGVQSR